MAGKGEKSKNRNRLACGVFAALFFALLVAQYPLWGLLRGRVDTQNRENRELAAMPLPGETTLEAFPGAFEDWLGDHAPFRNQWMTLNAAINWRVFGTVDSQVVLRGKEDWLFYKNAGDSAPLDDYQGTNPYSEAQMAEIATNLNALEAALAAKGVRLAVLMVPNKELVYRRYMPDAVPMVDPVGRIDRLEAYLQGQTEVPFLWPEAALRELGQRQAIYYKYDTHWNEAGAAYTSALLLRALGLHGPDAEGLEYVPGETVPLTDLAYLSATWKLVAQDESWRAAEWMPNEAVLQYADERGYVHRFSSGGPNPQKLLMFRDSFGEYMMQPLAACFAESSFVHINAFNENTLAEEAPDIFVLEITQRNADRLLDYLPRLVQWVTQEAA